MEIQRHDLHGVRATRKFVRDSLRVWGLDTVVDDLELMASEVVTNALIHADSHVDLRLREYPGRVRMEVRDSDASPPVPSAISAAEEEKAQSEHGRGLIIVDSIASAWGTSPNGRGKTVWLEIPTPSAHGDPNTAESVELADVWPPASSRPRPAGADYYVHADHADQRTGDEAASLHIL
jgi:anti-sigma regulatory factor (Ser/Thr protein kinase)